MKDLGSRFLFSYIAVETFQYLLCKVNVCVGEILYLLKANGSSGKILVYNNCQFRYLGPFVTFRTDAKKRFFLIQCRFN